MAFIKMLCTITMRDFLNDFSAGKIGVKYYLVKPLYSKEKRGAVTLVTSLVVMVVLLGVIKLLSVKGIDNTWVILITTIILISVPTFIIGKIILRYNITGKLYFHEDHLLIENNDETQKLAYQDIIKIEYCGSLPKDIFTNVGMSRPYVTCKVRFFTGLKDYQTIEVTRDMFVLPEEKEFTSKIYPIIERTLKAIKPRYGTSENPELRSA